MIPIYGLLYYLSSSKNAASTSSRHVCAIMRKLLNAIQAMLENRTPFDSRRFYTPTGTAAN